MPALVSLKETEVMNPEVATSTSNSKQNSENDDEHRQADNNVVKKDNAKSEEMQEGDNTVASITTPDVRPKRSLLEQLSNFPSSYTLPRCPLPSPSELQPIETFVLNAIQSQTAVEKDPNYVQGYRAILDALRRTTDPPLIFKVLIAMRLAGQGQALYLLTSHSTVHAQMTHLIFRFNSTKPNRKTLFQAAEVQCHGDEDAMKAYVADAEEYYTDGRMLDAHLHLILALVSAKSVNTVPALTIVWKLLSQNDDLPEFMCHRLHAMLATMMDMVPKSRTDFFPIIANQFPFWKWDLNYLTHYCIQSFQVLKYLPRVRQTLMELVIDKCLEIDVNIRIMDNGQVKIEEEEDNTTESGTKQNRKDTPIKNNNPNNDNKDENDEEKKKQEKAKKEEEEFQVISDKLDALLALLFETIRLESKNDVTCIRELYFELLPVFESTILVTHKSKFVQYCMFLVCGLESQQLEVNQLAAAAAAAAETQDETKENDEMPISSPAVVVRGPQHAILHRELASKLLETIVDPYRATMTRQSGACYLASFISRATFVGPVTVCESVSSLLRWAEAYIETIGQDKFFAPDAREQSELHSLFYTVCQAAFYIMCFRAREVMNFYKDALNGYPVWGAENDANNRGYLPSPEDINLGTKRWTDLCSHKLQPLRFCLESVRSEFLHVAHAYHLIDQPVLDKLVNHAKRLATGTVNKKAASSISTAATLEKQRQTGGVGGLGRGSNPLKSFFPFDPLLLRRSHGFIEPFYNHWQGPIEEEDILVIDDAPDPAEDDQVFEMEDEENADSSGDEQASGEEDDSEDEDDDDNEPVVVSDQEDADDEDDDNDDNDIMKTPEQKRDIQKKAWTEVLKRPRSQSMENGSW